MRNAGASQFSYEVFKSAYDSNPNFKELVKNFDRDVIELKSDSEMDDLPDQDPGQQGGDSVSKMAKRAAGKSSKF
jgi:hypothetical protein